ncbi:gamma-glutamyl-gamma-aminobutyrate hydrolase family protein [Paenibacillus septentrionalis]|uniref:Gamma-glutamyl-gamma-aminobutyrate hydrolase family protein n=1 Tax=Paenibacillus septentrionalis TaxID=429342 RepID=A0ABW1V0U9_9BACL
MRKPLIGISPLYDEHKESYWMLPGYMKAIEEAGGIPLMLPLTNDSSVLEQLITTIDGLLFTGGHDIHPALYGQQPVEECGTVITERDEMEKRLFQLAHAVDLPMFGICRGIQLFNALLGGTLYQDIPTQYETRLNHQQRPPYHQPCHEVMIERRSSLYRLLGTSMLNVNSYHHQAIHELAPGCQVMARASDGVVEAIEHPAYRFLKAVQWHPEFSHETDEASKALFRSFVEAAQQ